MKNQISGLASLPYMENVTDYNVKTSYKSTQQYRNILRSVNDPQDAFS